MSDSKNNRKAKDKAMAAFLKKKGVMRTTTACPHHCGSHPSVGQGLDRHLVSCTGAKRVDSRKMKGRVNASARSHLQETT